MKSVFDQMNLRPLERRLVVGGLIVIFIVINAWWVWPQFKEWSVVEGNTATLNQTLSDYQTKVNRLPALRAQEQELSKGADDTMALADSGSMGVTLLRIAQTKARQCEVFAAGYTPGAAHKIDQYFEEQTLSMPFQNAGDTNLLQFLLSIGDEGMIRVRDLTIKPDAGQTRLSGAVTLAATYQSQATVAPRTTAAPAPAPPTTKRP